MAAEQASRTAEAERLGRSAEARKAAEAARIANASAIEAEQNKQANAANEAVKTTATDKAAGNLTIRGSLKLLAGAGQQVRPGEVSEAVVYFLPAAGATRPKPGHYVMATKDKQFKPHLLVVPIGSTVSFTNEDPILHNVFSATPRSPFDLGVYGPGDVRDAHFDHAGLVQVSCNVHHSMRANVLVMETPYYTRPDATGLFELDNLPPGKGTLVFWHPRAAPQTLAVDGPITGLVSRKLTAVRAPIVGS